MSIDNSQIWDQGIGGPATAMLQQGSAGINPQPNPIQPQQQQQQQQAQMPMQQNGLEQFTNESALNNQGKVFFDGKWMTKQEYDSAIAAKNIANTNAGYGQQNFVSSGFAGQQNQSPMNSQQQQQPASQNIGFNYTSNEQGAVNKPPSGQWG